MMLSCRHCKEVVEGKKGLYAHLASNVCGWKNLKEETLTPLLPVEPTDVIIRDSEPGEVYIEDTLEEWTQNTAREVDEDEAEVEWGE